MYAFARILLLALLTTGCAASTAGMRSTLSEVKVEIAIHNDSTTRQMIPMWVNFEGKEIARGVIDPGKTWHQVTFLTHVWRIYAAPFEFGKSPVQSGNCTEVVREFVVSADTSLVMGVE